MTERKIKTKRACVVVLGDIGRSPRMQYHTKSLAENNLIVDLVGYVESDPLSEILSDPRVNIHKLTQFPEFQLPTLIKYCFKMMWQVLSLLSVFFSIKRPNFLLCQNPPGIPTLFVCYLYCKIVKAKLIIDWHNYTWTILAINSSSTSPIVRMAKFVESYFGKKGDFNFCVTEAMQKDLLDNWEISATVLYDRPPKHFQPISLEKKHDLFYKLSQTYSVFEAPDESSEVIESTIFTQKFISGEIELKAKRPALLISSTSWTPDEDFQILLNALEIYEEKANEDDKKYPELICAITGKGPLKKHYQALISEQEWKFVKIITPWLENQEYPQLLAAADLGVCLHWSSSGFDLPMKVVDMFGCGLPVCAINFQCLNELVKHGKNGFVFNNEKELSDQILNWFYEFPKNLSLVNVKEEFNRNLKHFQSLRWQENWEKNALPIFS